MNEGMMVKQLVKSEEPCWWRAVEGGHTISTRKTTGFSLQNQITKALCFFFSFLSHRPTGKKVPQPSPFSLPAVSPLPRQSGGQGHPPNVEWEGLSPRGGGGVGRGGASQYKSISCWRQPSPLLPSFPICPSSFLTSPPCLSSSSSLLLLPLLFHASLLSWLPTALSDGWLAPKSQPHCRAPMTCLCLPSSLLPLPQPPTTSRPNS